ncbi:MAG: transketolase, partial [Helicobacter sp.]|nr:transketolase [Helicobacter sp.]
NTYLQKEQDFPQGRNLHFGIREHSSAAITNAIAAYGLFLPFCATFFVFSDYLAPSVRLAALMKLRCFYIWTHDSIGVGEDGATHQPIEQLSHLRAMPGLYVFRPADANENVAAWQVALELQAPSAFVLSRQNLPVLQPCTQANIAHGGYILQSSSEIQLVLMASGSEVSLCLAVAQILESQNIGVQVVSVPCFDLLLEQNAEYQNLLFPSNTLRIAIEAARAFEWYRFADHVISMHSFGHSAPGEQLFKYFGFDAETIAGQILERLQNS